MQGSAHLGLLAALGVVILVCGGPWSGQRAVLEQRGHASGADAQARHATHRVVGDPGRGGAGRGSSSLAVWDRPVEEEEEDRRRLPVPKSGSDWLHPGLQVGGEGTFEEVDRLTKKMTNAQRQLEDAEGALSSAEDQIRQFQTPKAPPTVVSPEVDVHPRSIRDGEEVEITWSGVVGATGHDFLAVVSPPGAPNAEVIERVPVTGSAGWHLGSGRVKVALYNLRQEGGYQIRYFARSDLRDDASLFVSRSAGLLDDLVICQPRGETDLSQPRAGPCGEGDAVWLLAASSPSVTFPPHEPTQARLSLTHDNTEMRLMWTSTQCPPGPLGGPIIVYGTEPCGRGSEGVASSARDYAQGRGEGGCRYAKHVVPLYRTYGREDLCGAPANVPSIAQGFLPVGHIYDGVMTGLVPGRRYYYRYGCKDSRGGWEQSHSSFSGGGGHSWAGGVMLSEERVFTAAPPVGPGTRTRMLLVGDSGVSGAAPDLNGHVSRGAPELVAKHMSLDVAANGGLVHHVGDIVYSGGRGFRWEQWGSVVEGMATSAPLMVSPGNHEYDHRAQVWVRLSGRGVPSGVSLLASPSPFGPAITRWSDPSREGRVVAASKGSLCAEEEPTEGEVREGLAVFEGAIVAALGGDECSATVQAKRAEMFGAKGVIFLTGSDAQGPPPRTSSPPTSWHHRVGIPSLSLPRAEGEQLLRYYAGAAPSTPPAAQSWGSKIWGGGGGDKDGGQGGLTASISGSANLQHNDPSIPFGGGADGGFHPSWGNYADDSWGECGVPFAQRFHMPGGVAGGSGGGGNGNFWYSYDYGSVHVTSLSTEHDFTKGSPQRVWLERDLKGVDRERTPWLIVTMHRPMYSRLLSASDQRVSLHLQRELEPLFYSQKVNLVVSGHEHRYMRSFPVYKDINQQSSVKHSGAGAPTYVVVGTGGARPVYRAKDLTHLSYYCVGGSREMHRCRVCPHKALACRDYAHCCEHKASRNFAGIQSGRLTGCGYCERVNATGPGPRANSNPAGERDASEWGWYAHGESSFGYLRLEALSPSRLKVEFVRSFEVNHEPTMDASGRSLHVPAAVKVGCKLNCLLDDEGRVDGSVSDHVIITR